MAVDMVIKNGTVVVPNSSLRAHVIIDEGKVKELTPFDELPEARETIDATGLHVLPGLIDPHVHFRVPGMDYKEDFTSGSQAAVAGGITTIIDMPNVTPMTKDVEGFNAKMDCAVGKSHCEFGVYAVIVEDSKKHIPALADAGVLGYKIFLGSTVGGIEPPSDGEILDAWNIMRETGLRCGIHAEDNSILHYLTDKLQKQGRKDPLAHLEARPSIAEAEAISRAIMFAEHCNSKLMIYHMAAKEGVYLIRAAKARGVDVMGETGPHYLLCNAQDMITKGLGSMLKMNPPVRESDHGAVLWEGLLDGTIEVIGTDHSPHTPEEKMEDDRFSDIWKAIPGWPGVETNVPLMLNAVNEGKLSLNLYVERQSEGPARAWNMWPRKGNLNVGADGDVTIVDMNKEATIDKNKLHSKPKITPYHGWKVKGMPVYTIIRGTVVAKEGEVVGGPIGELQRPIV